MGSGKHLNRAIDKYGIENFEKEILFIFDNETGMDEKEAELVSEEFVKEDTNYNLCPGGKGGWGYVNATGLNNSNMDQRKKSLSKAFKGIKRTPNFSESMKESYKNGNRTPAGAFSKEGAAEMRKRAWSEDAREKRAKTRKKNNFQVGENNSNYGTMWITDGVDSKKIKKDQPIPNGWYKGRKMK